MPRSNTVANGIFLVLIVVLVLLASQAEPVTAFLGYSFAVLFSLAVLANYLKGK